MRDGFQEKASLKIIPKSVIKKRKKEEPKIKISINDNNIVSLRGRIAHVNEYVKGKAANVVIAINDKDQYGQALPPSYINTKCFRPACYNTLRKGMLVQAYGFVQPNQHEKNGETIYAQDIIVDHIELLESRHVIEEREARNGNA